MTLSPLRSTEEAAETGQQTQHMLTIAETAKELRVSKWHVQRLIHGQVKGCPRLPAIPMGQRFLIRRETLERYILDQESAFSNGVQSHA